MPSRSTPDGDNPRDFVTALARGLEVIQAFGADAPEMTLSEIARRTSMSAATVRRSLITLGQLGYVRRHERRFLLGPKVLTLGASYLESMNLKELAQHHLVELVERFHDAASLTVLDNFEVVYIAHVPSDQRVRHGRSVGSRLPAHATSTGIVLLAHASDEHQRQLLRTATDFPVLHRANAGPGQGSAGPSGPGAGRRLRRRVRHDRIRSDRSCSAGARRPRQGRGR